MSDQNKIAVILESGTYSNPSGIGFWPGLVQDFDIPEKENVIQTRYIGQGNRNVGRFDGGPQDIEGTLSILPQDWRFLGFALGSIQMISGTAQTDNYQYIMSEVNSNTRANANTSGTFNPWISFSLEDSRTGNVANKNFIRTFRGCVVNSYKMDIKQAEPVMTEIGFVAQVGSWFSGATTAITAGSYRPYLWSDASLSINGTAYEPVTNVTFTINNNFDKPHYLNGSRVIGVPIPLNRDYTVDVVQHLDSATMGSLYDTAFKGGSLFNSSVDINASTTNAGSHRLTLFFSGCKMIEMSPPAKIGGVNELNYTFVPGSVSAIAHDRAIMYTLF